ncbi:putative NADPH-cytochrome P450 reductase (CprA) [Colletotrichum scovillei]|uniref:putative NADPH-cytochrome P450 reductase (CprA) n=1 Tax=Colletotrichum scovillei TaxID=1209932 RepID=UPI0015C38D3B|nr:putative NADPH-cytochrome P450 reductase (CprA) [Colletotrichum scovillei]KAF4772826.1 putative NADPH-cytochrome P450 reductase (CprA) [Colletotrichum scovillei]
MREFNFTEHTIPYQPSLKIQENTNLSVSQIFHGHPLPAIADRGQRPQPLEIRTIRKLWETAERLCLHIDVDLGVDRSVKYKTGGHLAIWPSNPSHEVDRLIAALSLTGKEHVPITIEAAKQPGQMPISIPTPTTIHALSADDFQSEIVVPHATLADVLENTCAKGVGVWNIPLSFILERTKPMKPRLYSISSSTIVHPRTVSITAVVTKTPACPPRSPHRYNGCYGLTTAYLRALESAINDTKRSVMTSEVQPSETMPFDLHGPGAVLAGKSMFGIVRQSSFKLPNKASTPIIMIGAGTGIAPFRGFVQERVKRKELGQEIGETILLMGFRNSTVDFIYRNEWKEWREILTPAIFKYKVAFSRDDECEKLHVQDLLIQSGREIFRLLNGDVPCQVYICGAAAMARNVMTTLATLKMTFCNVGEVEALAWVKKMQQSKRILEDVWG